MPYVHPPSCSTPQDLHHPRQEYTLRLKRSITVEIAVLISFLWSQQFKHSIFNPVHLLRWNCLFKSTKMGSSIQRIESWKTPCASYPTRHLVEYEFYACSVFMCMRIWITQILWNRKRSLVSLSVALWASTTPKDLLWSVSTFCRSLAPIIDDVARCRLLNSIKNASVTRGKFLEY